LRHDLQPFGPHLIQCALDETGADALAAELSGHLGMLEDDDVAFALVIGRGQVAFDLELEAVFCRVVVNRIGHVTPPVISLRRHCEDCPRPLLQGPKGFPRVGKTYAPDAAGPVA
jgi:hypothetical protein